MIGRDTVACLVVLLSTNATSDELVNVENSSAFATSTNSNNTGLTRAIGVETLLSGGNVSTLMDRDYDEWIEEEWDLSQFLIAPVPQTSELDIMNNFAADLQF